jgi:hypothetical protein
MEYVFIKYFRSRNVFMDGNFLGKTSETLRVEKGKHRFDLGVPKNYTPHLKKITVKDTTQILPEEVELTYLGGEA